MGTKQNVSTRALSQGCFRGFSTRVAMKLLPVVLRFALWKRRATAMRAENHGQRKHVNRQCPARFLPGTVGRNAGPPKSRRGISKNRNAADGGDQFHSTYANHAIRKSEPARWASEWLPLRNFKRLYLGRYTIRFYVAITIYYTILELLI